MKYVVPIHSREDSYLDKLIQQKFSTSLMNNSKWVKLIAVLVDNWTEVKECLVKPIWDDNKPSRHLRFDEHTYYEFDYYASAMESMVSGNPRGWYAYKEIEWLDFPRTVTAGKGVGTVTQNLGIIKGILDKVGHYKLEITEENLRLYAYLR